MQTEIKNYKTKIQKLCMAKHIKLLWSYSKGYPTKRGSSRPWKQSTNQKNTNGGIVGVKTLFVDEVLVLW